jgi:hypothetical protein
MISSLARRAPDVCCFGVAAILLWALFVEPTATGQSPGVRRFLTVEVSGQWRLAQRFRMNRPDFSAIEIRPAAVGPVAGRYVLTLRDREAPDIARVGEVAAADLVKDESYTFQFAPIANSAGHEFQFEISPAAAPRGGGIAFWATKGARRDEGALSINDQPRWASLVFQTHTPAVPLIRALLRKDGPDRPPQWLALVGLVAFCLSLRVVLRAVSGAETEIGGAAARIRTGAADALGVAPESNPSSGDALEAPPAAVR